MNESTCETVPNAKRALKHCCCTLNNDNDPFNFEEDGFSYKACCGLIHVKKLAVYLIATKSVMSFGMLISKMVKGQEMIWNIAHMFCLMVALSTYGLFLAGISHKRLGYLVPHLCYSIVTILILIVQLYIDLLLVAGSRDATDSSKTLSVFLQVFVIAFEVYTVVILWCVFDYISGWLVSEDLKKEAHANLAKQRSENWCKNSFISLPSQTKDVFVAKEALEQSKSAATFNNYMLI